MTVRLFTIGTILTALGSVAIWVAILNYLSPQQAGYTGYFLFFLSFFLAAASLTALIGFLLRRFIARHVLAAYAVRTSLRQGIFLGVFLCLLFALQLFNLYVWWLVIIIFSLLLTLELIFLGYDRAHFRRSRHSPARS